MKLTLNRRVQVLFFSTLLLLYVFAPRYVGMGHASRFDLTRAIVHNSTFAIDPYVDNTIDWSYHDGHYYTNKAPGVSLMAVPVYFVFHKLETWLKIDTTDWGFRNLRWTDVVVTAIPSVVGCWILLAILLHWSQGSPHRRAGSWSVIFAYALGTMIFPFSAMMWAHPTAAAWLIIGFYFLTVKFRPYWVGFFLGLAVLCEYSTAIAIPPFFAYLIFKGFKERSPLQGTLGDALTWVLWGALPWAAIFAYYHYTCFGSPFYLANRFQNPSHGLDVSQKFAGVIGLPDFEVLFQLLVGSRRGLFVGSPILALSIWGFYNWLRDRKLQWEGAVSLFIVVGFFLFNASFNGWHAGCSAGPRYLIPMLPFMAMALLWVPRGFLFYGSLFVSVVNMAAIAAVNTTPPPLRPLLNKEIYPNLVAQNRITGQFLPIVFTVLALFLWSRWLARFERRIPG